MRGVQTALEYVLSKCANLRYNHWLFLQDQVLVIKLLSLLFHFDWCLYLETCKKPLIKSQLDFNTLSAENKYIRKRLVLPLYRVLVKSIGTP